MGQHQSSSASYQKEPSLEDRVRIYEREWMNAVDHYYQSHVLLRQKEIEVATLTEQNQQLHIELQTCQELVRKSLSQVERYRKRAHEYLQENERLLIKLSTQKQQWQPEPPMTELVLPGANPNSPSSHPTPPLPNRSHHRSRHRRKSKSHQEGIVPTPILSVYQTILSESQLNRPALPPDWREDETESEDSETEMNHQTSIRLPGETVRANRDLKVKLPHQVLETPALLVAHLLK